MWETNDLHVSSSFSIFDIAFNCIDYKEGENYNYNIPFQPVCNWNWHHIISVCSTIFKFITEWGKFRRRRRSAIDVSSYLLHVIRVVEIQSIYEYILCLRSNTTLYTLDYASSTAVLSTSTPHFTFPFILFLIIATSYQLTYSKAYTIVLCTNCQWFVRTLLFMKIV